MVDEATTQNNYKLPLNTVLHNLFSIVALLWKLQADEDILNTLRFFTCGWGDGVCAFRIVSRTAMWLRDS